MSGGSHLAFQSAVWTYPSKKKEVRTLECKIQKSGEKKFFWGLTSMINISHSCNRNAEDLVDLYIYENFTILGFQNCILLSET